MTRLERLRRRMASEDIDLVALAPGAHFSWLLSFRPHSDERPLLFCATARGEGLLMPALEADSTRQHTDLPFFEWSDAEGPDSAFEALLASIEGTSAGSIALDECMRADHAALVQDRFPGARRRFSETTIGALRMRKDETEYEVLKRGAICADRAMKDAWAGMTPGMTEAEVAAIVHKSFAEQGARPLFSIVGAGPNGAFPHHQTGDTELKVGDAVVMDIGAEMNGYASDITRMAVLGSLPDGFAELHAVVDAAVEAAIAAARPGVKARALDAAARGVVDQAGYGAYFFHRTGHGLGTEVHEPPYISASSDTVLDEGMVFSIEPGIYLPERFGLRLEEIVILRADGPEILSDLSREIRVID